MKLLAAAVACLALGAAGYASGAEAERVVTVTIHNSHYSLDSLDVHEGETITFVLRNEDPIAHEFIVGGRRIQRVHENGTEAYHDSIPTEVTIPQGEEVKTTITFANGGPLDLNKPLWFACHFPGHYDYGMVGRIRIP